MNDFEKSEARRAVMDRIDAVKDLPTVPHVLLEINRMLQDADTSNTKLQEVIEKDQVITAKVLRLVNSYLYARRSGIADISQALMIMGFESVRNSIATVAAIDMFRMKAKYDHFDIRDLWKHSIAVAVTSRYLAETARIAPPSDAFVAGLLHDIGKLVMARHLPDLFAPVLALQQEKGLSFIDAERKALPIDHAAIGGHLVRKWHFPASLADAIEYHHEVKRTAFDFWLHLAVYAANVYANHEFRDSANDEIRTAFPEFSSLEPLLGDFKSWHPAVEKEIEEHCQSF